MDFTQFYDKYDEDSIVSYAEKLVGKTFLDVIEERIPGNRDEIMRTYGNQARKGGLGNLLEEVYFGYKANSKQDADFEETGIFIDVDNFQKLDYAVAPVLVNVVCN